MRFGGWLALGLVWAGAVAEADERRPNVVLLLADDLGWGDVGFHGRTTWTTPNLDRLVAEGGHCRRFYTAAVVCAPSRAALLTGKAPIHCGVSRNEADLPASEVTIAEALAALGYDTALFGKWHHGRPSPGSNGFVHPLDQGFGTFYGFTDAVDAFEKFPDALYVDRERKTVHGYADDLFAEQATRFLDGREPGDRPFFLEVAFTAPHFSVEAPADELARHRGRFPERDADQPVNAAYAAMVTRLDAHVGQVLDTLRRRGLEEQTLVVFTSDHGATFESGNQGASAFHDSNRPFRGQKRTLWEGGVRVPLAVRWPGHVTPGTWSDTPSQMIDLLPTLLGAAGGEPDPAWKVDGVNLLPGWTGGPACPDRTLLFEWRSEGSDVAAAVRGNLKLMMPRGQRPELYDVVADPGERIDVASTYPEVVRRLKGEIQAWLATEVAGPANPTGGTVR